MKQAIILVHGAFHAGDCWGLLEPQLLARGFEVHAPTLGGHRGTVRPAADVSMRSYGADIIACAEEIGRPCVLLGHSMGGMAISQAAEQRPDLFETLIYLAAYAPPYGGASLGDLPPVSQLMTAALMSGLERRPDGTAVFPADGAREVFYNRCTPEEQAFALARLSPQPLGATGEPVVTTRARLGSLPKHYIECVDDQALPIESQRAMQAHMRFASVHTLASDHSPFISAPTALADVVEQIASA
jgi:pimeloyl-ACP methyl ester carboxylesterase